MRSAVIFFISVLLCISAKAQHKAYTDYYFEAKALTDNLKTYQILIQAHGETFPFISNEYVKNEVARSFNFLNIKKRVDKNPDFVIKIIVSDVSAKVEYVDKGKVYEFNTYDIVLNYDVSFALSFEVNEKDSIYIPLVTKKHYHTRQNYSQRNTDYNPKAGRFTLATPDENKPIWKYVADLEESMNTRGTFIREFNEVLIKFRKKK